MASKILITAFSPFGIRGAVSGRNASRQVLNLIKGKFPERFEYLILPVERSCEELLTDSLASINPAGIVSLGELMTLPPTNIRVEPSAILAPLSVLPRFGRGKTVPSSYVQSIDDSVESDATGIGLYFCNRVYLSALAWSNKNAKPAVFLHIPVLGNRKTHMEQVLGKVEAMQRFIQ